MVQQSPSGKQSGSDVQESMGLQQGLQVALNLPECFGLPGDALGLSYLHLNCTLMFLSHDHNHTLPFSSSISDSVSLTAIKLDDVI
jgi:hypothetical protein